MIFMSSLRRRNIEKSEEGVATTVGTIMALLIFLSLLSLITQQYVPIWMEDNEAYHMDEVQGQMASMKGGIDSLILNDQKGYPRYSSVTLGAEGIPLFAGSTPGSIRFNPRWGSDVDKGMNLTFTASEDENTTLRSSGNISVKSYNRYYEDQTLVYEHGAILLEQEEGEVMRAAPPIRIDEVEGKYRIRITMVDLVGSERHLAGTATVGVTTELVSSFSNTYEDPTNLNLSLTTGYPELWRTHLNNETDVEDIGRDGSTLKMDLGNDVYELKVTRARINVEMSM